jgi:hypothetical protein
MANVLVPKYANKQRVIWNNYGKSIAVTISQVFVCERSRVGYHLVGFHQDTWAWEEELFPANEQD